MNGALVASMDSGFARQVAAALARVEEPGVAPVAEAVVRAWMLIDHELAPIIGPAGVAAMYRRGIHLCSGAHPDLRAALGPVQRQLDAEPLRAVLLSQDVAAAAALGAALLQTFHDLLSGMVGPALTERLLRNVWNDFSGDAPAEDPAS
jgi:hypothetical protein